MDLARFQEMKRYVGFTDEDLRVLRAHADLARPHFPEVVDDFYARILASPVLRSLIADEAQVARLKQTLTKWLEEVFTGGFDEDHLELRTRIGRMHVRIGLAPSFVIAAMDVIRRHLATAIARGEASIDARMALQKALDLELGILVASYEEAQEEQIRRMERLATIGQLAASVNHDLKSPLGAIGSSVYLLRQIPAVAGNADAARHVDTIQRNVDQAQRVIASLLDYVRSRPLECREVDLRQAISECLRRMTLPTGVRARVEAPGRPIRLRADEGELARVVANLVQNAVEAMGGEGQIAFSFREEKGDVVLEVEDTGPGIPAENLRRVFDPLFTTKPAGTGLGLAICWNIVRAHGGAIEAQSPAGRGARFVIRLPRLGPLPGGTAHA